MGPEEEFTDREILRIALVVAAVFLAHRRGVKEESLRIGSLKANAGHTEPNAGLAGALKLSMQLLEAWGRNIRPAGDELAWQSIDWLPTFAQGVLEADAQRKPLLFWAMNGHPLGCT